MRAPKGQKNRALFRWAKGGSSEMEAALTKAAERLVRPLEEAGFSWVDKAFDASAVPAHSINLERNVGASTDFVLVIFDKRRRPRFQVVFGSKTTTFPHSWLKAGSLVWRQGSESVKYKWWGAKWWHIGKTEALDRAVDEAAALMSQVIRFLSTGESQQYVRPDLIPQK